MDDKKKIIFVDDEVDLCQLVKENLEETGAFDVITVSQSEKAEAICRQEKPDLILLDNVMPGKKGSEIAKAIKNDPLTKDIPVIIVSGRGEIVFFKKKEQFRWLPNSPIVKTRGEASNERSHEKLSTLYGVDDYINKPFRTEVLIEVINEVLTRKKKEIEARKAENERQPGF